MRRQLILVCCLGLGSLSAEVAWAVDCSGLDSWDSQIAYLGGAEVEHAGSGYRANWWTRNQDPATHSGQWQEWTLLGPCDGSPPPGNEPPVAEANGPYSGAAGSGQTSVAVTQQALDCLIGRSRCGSYVPAQARPGFRGLMTWSITWDWASGFGFSGPHRAYLDQNP